ncbi:MAG: hypothetical protein KGJ06_00950 [Pseudomonadota bacterium]|nr:hypothetical protein [Pseudomonadota bacterium]
MTPAEKLLTVAHLVRVVYGRWLYQRLLPGIMAAVGLAVAAGLLAAIVLIGIFTIGYMALVQHGFEPIPAMLIVSAAAAVVALICALLLMRRLRLLRDIPLRSFRRSPVGVMGGTIDAFFEGILQGAEHPHH